MDNISNNLSLELVKSLLDALQEAQFQMYVTAQMLNKAADDITETVKKAGIPIVNFPAIKHSA